MVVPTQNSERMARVIDMFTAAGFQVASSGDSETMLGNLKETAPDIIVILDDLKGRPQFCSEIRKISNVPIVAILDSGNDVRRARMLEFGVDVCLSEPVGKMELVARAHSLFRRYRKSKSKNPHLDPQTRQVHLGDRTVKLTPTDFRLFSCLIFNEGQVVPYAQLINQVWGEEVALDTIHSRMRHLRQALGIELDGPYRLQPYRGEGYCFHKA